MYECKNSLGPRWVFVRIAIFWLGLVALPRKQERDHVQEWRKSISNYLNLFLSILIYFYLFKLIISIWIYNWRNNPETNRHPWNTLDTSLKLALIFPFYQLSNTLHTLFTHPSHTLYTPFTHSLHTLYTPMKHTCYTKQPCNSLETCYKLFPWNTFKTPLKHPRNTNGTPLKHP